MNAYPVRRLALFALFFLALWALPATSGLAQSASDQSGPVIIQSLPADSAFAKPRVRTEADGRTIVPLSIPDTVGINPTMSGKALILSFTPPLPALALPDPAGSALLKYAATIPGPDGANIGGLRLTLASEFCRFLLVRRDAANIDLLLKPAVDTPEAGVSGESGQIIPSFGKEIGNIEFTQAADNSLLIKVDGPHDMDFRTAEDRPDAITLLFPEVSAAKAIAKFYNLGKFNSIAQTAWLQNSAQGARLTVALSRKTPLAVERRLGKIIFKFPAGQGTAPAVAQAAPAAGPAQGLTRKKNLKSEASEAEDLLTNYAGRETQYVGEPISIDVQDADVRHVLRLIAQYAGFNLIYDDEVAGRVSLKLTNVPWDQVLDIVLRQRGLDKTFKDNVMRIATLTKIRNENEAISKSIEAEPVVTQTIKLNYISATQVAPMIAPPCTGSSSFCTTIDTFTNSVIVTGQPSKIRRWRKICSDMDKLEPQVLIEARVVYATDTFERALGLNWGATQAGLSASAGPEGKWITNSAAVGNGVNLPTVTSSASNNVVSATLSKLTGTDIFTLDAKLQLAEYDNLAKTISSPKVVTLNNKPAVVIQGTQIPYTSSSANSGPNTQFISANLELNVTPQITPDNKFILKLKIKDDNQGQIVNGSTAIETKSIETSLISSNGETIVIGGVQKQSTTSTQSKVPGLGDVPVLGWLFKSDYNKINKVELLVFIRATLLNR